LALFREVDDKEYIAYSLFSLALVASSQGEYTLACSLFEESLAIHRRLHNKRGIAHELKRAWYSTRRWGTGMAPLSLSPL
jgi:hypothetical protein